MVLPGTAAAILQLMSLASWIKKSYDFVQEQVDARKLAKGRLGTMKTDKLAQELGTRLVEARTVGEALKDEKAGIERAVQLLQEAEAKGRRVPGVDDVQASLRRRSARLHVIGEALEVLRAEQDALLALRNVVDSARFRGLTMGEQLALDEQVKLEDQIAQLKVSTQLVDRKVRERKHVLEALGDLDDLVGDGGS